MNQGTLAKYPLAFTADQTRLLKVYLERLAKRVSASHVMLADVSGRLALSFGSLQAHHSIELAAIASGSFAAGIEIYKVLGVSNEQQVSQLLYEGKPVNILTTQIDGELLLIIAFEENSKIASAQILAEQVCVEISKIVQTALLNRHKGPGPN